MYHVVVVDDEQRQCRGLQTILHKSYSNLEVVPFRDPLEALKHIQQQAADLIITDIRMPEISGLELVKRIRATDSNAIVIILSGYPDFHYAQEAMALGAFDFLTKPLNIEKMHSVLKRALKLLEERRALGEQHSRMQQKLDATLPLYIDNLLNQWMTGALTQHNRSELADVLPMNSRGLVMLSQPILLSTADSSPEACQLQIKWLIRQELKALGSSISFFSNTLPDTVVTILAQADPAPRSDERDVLQRCLRRLCQQLAKTAGRHVTIGVGPLAPALENNLAQSYQGAIEALKFRFYTPDLPVIYADELLVKRSRVIESSLVEEDLLRSAISAGDPQRIGSVVQAVVARHLQGGHPDPERLVQGLNSYLHHICIFFKKLYTQPEWQDFLMQMDEAFGLVHTLPQLQMLCAAQAGQLAERVARQKLGRSDEFCQKLADYLDLHFRQDISLDQIASHFELTPSYFSYVVKLYTGASFSKHLLQRRLDYAKKLLANPSLHIYEIAKEAGYPDVKYFNRIFRKEVLLSPVAYRTEVLHLAPGPERKEG